MRLLVASIPRCGSTLLLRAIAGFPPGSTMPRVPYCAFVRDLERLPDVPFLKTHSLAPKELPTDVRTIFLFGDPIRAVVSTREKRFDRNHFENCGYFEDELPDIYARDDLGYEKIFDTWTSEHPYPVLAVRFESLWEHEELVSRYLGRGIILPPKKRRATKVSKETRQQLSNVYGRLAKKIARFPDAKLTRDTDAYNSRKVPSQNHQRKILLYDSRLPMHRLALINLQHISQMLGWRGLYETIQTWGKTKKSLIRRLLVF